MLRGNGSNRVHREKVGGWVVSKKLKLYIIARTEVEHIYSYSVHRYIGKCRVSPLDGQGMPAKESVWVSYHNANNVHNELEQRFTNNTVNCQAMKQYSNSWDHGQECHLQVGGIG